MSTSKESPEPVQKVWPPLADPERHKRLLAETRRTMFAMVEVINDLAAEVGCDFCLEVDFCGIEAEILDVYLSGFPEKDGSQAVNILHGAVLQARKELPVFVKETDENPFEDSDGMTCCAPSAEESNA